MKNLTITIALFIAIILTATSCAKDRMLVKGQGTDVKITRDIKNFTGVSLCISADVEIYQDSVYHVELNGQQNILDVIETKVSGENLNIGLKNFTSLRSHNKIVIRIYMPNLKALDVSGSGKIIGMTGLNTADLKANVSGSGEINLNGIVTNSFTANVSGSGDIIFYGNNSCVRADYKVSGSGNINAEWFRVDTVDANVSGSGEMSIYVVKQLNANISGSGKIWYRGNPSTQIKISGSGKVSSIN
ncbi:MAG: DUF2807 domain-containing protein [bacterium]|nr:DUF2807 domain-containing protein [bacterium]